MAKQESNENADIEYLIKTLEEDLNLLGDYEDSAINPNAKEYLKCFHKYLSLSNHQNNVVEFIDYGLKIMNYLQK